MNSSALRREWKASQLHLLQAMKWHAYTAKYPEAAMKQQSFSFYVSHVNDGLYIHAHKSVQMHSTHVWRVCAFHMDSGNQNLVPHTCGASLSTKLSHLFGPSLFLLL